MQPFSMVVCRVWLLIFSVSAKFTADYEQHLRESMANEASSTPFGVAPSSGTLILRLLESEPPRLHRDAFGALTDVSLRAVGDLPTESAIVLSDTKDGFGSEFGCGFDCGAWTACDFGGRGQRSYLIDELRERPSMLCF